MPSNKIFCTTYKDNDIIEYTDKKSAELHIRVEVPPTFLSHRAGVLYAGALRRHRSGYLNTEGCPVYQKHV